MAGHGNSNSISATLRPPGVPLQGLALLMLISAHHQRTWLKDLSDLSGMSYRACFRNRFLPLCSSSSEAFYGITQSNPNTELISCSEAGCQANPFPLLLPGDPASCCLAPSGLTQGLATALDTSFLVALIAGTDSL